MRCSTDLGSPQGTASTASGNLCPFKGAGSCDDFPECRVSGVIVAPGDVATDHPRLLPVADKVGAVQREVAQSGELRFDPVQPGAVKRDVGEFDVVGHSPVPDPAIGPGGPVRGEVIQDDADPHLWWVQGTEVAAESEKLRPGLGLLDVAVEPVGGQIKAASR